MKPLFCRLGLGKPDEMERQMTLTALGVTCIFLLTALGTWTLWEGWQALAFHQGPNPLPGGLLAAALLLFAFSRLTLARNAVKDDPDSFEAGPFRGLVLLTCLTVGATAAAAAALLLLGVRM
ncbi:MAG: hypothetical protein HFF11_00950 [Angelakisella sp.]|jgi:hypothetical protein|nr:hypothetical protein [Angelakisella sp.]